MDELSGQTCILSLYVLHCVCTAQDNTRKKEGKTLQLAEFVSSKHCNCSLPNPVNWMLTKPLSLHAAQLYKQDYSLWQHLEAARACSRENQSWLTAADNDTAIFILLFGKGQANQSTTKHSQQFYFLNSASVTLNPVLERSNRITQILILTLSLQHF